MSDKTIQQRIQIMRSQAEELFYASGAYFDDDQRENVEKLAIGMLKVLKQKEIALHTEFIKYCDAGAKYETNPDHIFSNKYNRGWENGIHTANEARKKTHEINLL